MAAPVKDVRKISQARGDESGGTRDAHRLYISSFFFKNFCLVYITG